MEEQSKYAFGVDVGTENVRAVALEIKGEDVKVIAYGSAANEKGMRKGIVTDLSGPAEATDKALKVVEGMSGVNVDSAYVSINGSHLSSEQVTGMIAVSSGEGITNEDLDRLEDTAMSGRITSNRQVLDVIPLNYTLDGQSGIRQPLGMVANKIEIVANVISGLTPSVDALGRAMAQATLRVLRFVPTPVAAARAVLTEKQMENGVCVIDFGASTTSIAVYADFTPTGKEIAMRHNGESIVFKKDEVNQVVKERLVDIFSHVYEHLERAGYAQKLPEGAVLTGAGSNMKGIAGFAKEVLKMATRVGVPGAGLSGVIEDIEKPEYAVAIGLALTMADDGKFSGVEEEKEKKPFSLFGLFKKKK